MSDGKTILGHIDCPVCGHEMPVKADKNGHAYAHCSHGCNAQVFARNTHRDGLLRKRMRAVTVTGTGTDQPTPAAPPSVTVPAPVPKPAAPGVPEPIAMPDPKPQPKQRAGWLQPVIGATRGRA